MDFYKLSEFKGQNFSKAVNELYSLTDFNNLQYPGYLKWFYQTNIPRILDNKGEALFSLDGFLLKGLIVLKNTVEEKKICTLVIDKPYSRQKLGLQLLERSFGYLGTDKPLITIPKAKIDEFDSIINYYSWENTGKTDEYNSEELIFNQK